MRKQHNTTHMRAQVANVNKMQIYCTANSTKPTVVSSSNNNGNKKQFKMPQATRSRLERSNSHGQRARNSAKRERATNSMLMQPGKGLVVISYSSMQHDDGAQLFGDAKQAPPSWNFATLRPIISLILFALFANSMHKIATAQNVVDLVGSQTGASNISATISVPLRYLEEDLDGGSVLKTNEAGGDERPLIDRRDNAMQDGFDQESAGNKKLDRSEQQQQRTTGGEIVAMRKQQFRALNTNNWPKVFQSSKFTRSRQHLNGGGVTSNQSGAKSAIVGDFKMFARRAVESKPVKDRTSGVDSSSSSSSSSATGLPKANSKKINSAVLKKLLQQTLPKTANDSLATNDAGTKASNFKFIFIQRATAAPSSRGSTNKHATITKNNNNALSRDQISEQTKTGAIQSEPKQQSLAVSVSKQLASTLLYSAANLVGNLTNVPSLSSIAIHANRSSLANIAAEHSNITEHSSNALTTSTIVDSSTQKSTSTTTRRPTFVESINSGKNFSNEIKRSGQSGTTRINISKGKNSNPSSPRPKSRPSKIYKLPLRFASNGQPNGIVLSTFKEHLSMIKRIQANTKNVADSSARFNTKKVNNGKLKGNSRLIYLPLRYLSNAKPSMLQAIATRASHKSGVNVRH